MLKMRRIWVVTMQAAGTPPPEELGHSWILSSWFSRIMEHKSLRQLLKMRCMKGLHSLLIASCTKESREMKPFGEISLFELRLVRKEVIVSERP